MVEDVLCHPSGGAGAFKTLRRWQATAGNPADRKIAAVLEDIAKKHVPGRPVGKGARGGGGGWNYELRNQKERSFFFALWVRE